MMGVQWTRWCRPLAVALVLATALLFGPTVIASAATRPVRTPSTDVQQIDRHSGDESDQAFLAQMSLRHAMGVMMTYPAVSRGAHRELKEVGALMIADQSREISVMRGRLLDWYARDVACQMAQGTALGMVPGWAPGAPGQQPGGMMPERGPGMMPGSMGPGMMPGAARIVPPFRGRSTLGPCSPHPDNRGETTQPSAPISDGTSYVGHGNEHTAVDDRGPAEAGVPAIDSHD